MPSLTRQESSDSLSTEPIDSLPFSPIVSINFDPPKETVSCTTPSQPTPTSEKNQEKPVKPIETKVPSLKPPKKSWFKSLASLFKSPVTGNAVESPVEIIEASENDSVSSQVIETSNSEFELPLEKVTSFLQIEELNASKVEELEVESCLPPLLDPNTKREIITDFLDKHDYHKRKKGKQKSPRSCSKRSKKQNSQQKPSSQSLPITVIGLRYNGDRTEKQVTEPPTNSSKNVSKDRVCSNATGPVGRFKNSLGSGVVSRDEYSEHNADSEDSGEFQTCSEEMIPSETSLSNMNSSDTNPSVKLLNNSSLTSTERKNLCWEIGMKENSKRLDRMRQSEKRI